MECHLYFNSYYDDVFQGWDFKTNIEHIHSPVELYTKANFIYGPHSEIRCELGLKKESMIPLKMSAVAKLKYPGRTLAYTYDLEEKKRNVYHQGIIIKVDKYNDVSLTSVYMMGPRHELNAELRLPGINPITFVGHLKPVINNFQAYAMTTFEGNEYAFDSTWNIKGTTTTFKSTSGFTVSIPSRKITLETEVNRKDDTVSGSLETKWDAARNGRKKFSLSAETTLTAAPHFQIKSQWWPNQFIELSGNYKMDNHNGWWTTHHEMEGTMQFLSTFPGFENINVVMTHDKDPQKIKTRYELAWATDRKVDVDFNLNWIRGWSNMNADLTLQTPFPAAHVIKVETQHNLQSTMLGSHYQVQWDGKKIGIDVTGKLEPLEGMITLYSPLRDYEEISLSGKQQSHGHRSNAKLTASWGNHQTARIIFNMNHYRKDWDITNNGDITITTPIKYLNSKIEWTHINNQQIIKSHAEITLDGQTSVFDLQGKFTEKTELKATLMSPYFTTMGFDLNHKGSMSDMRSGGSITYGAGKLFQVNNEFSMDMGRKLIMKTILNTPYETIIMDLNNRKQFDEFIMENYIQWGTNKCSLSGTFTPNFPLFDGKIQFTSPFTKTLKLASSNKNVHNVYVLTANAIYGNQTLVKSDFRLGMERMKKVSAAIKTPWEIMENFNFDLEHIGPSSNFDTKVQLSHNMLKSPMKFNVAVDINSFDDMNAKANFQSPIKALRFVHTIMNHKMIGRDNYQTGFTFEIPNNKVAATNTISLSITNFNCRGEIEYTPSQKIEWNAILSPVNGSVSIKAPFFMEKSISFHHQGDKSNFQTDVEIGLDPQQKINGIVQLQLSMNAISTSAKITTPFTDFSPIGFKFSGKGSPSVSNPVNIKGDMSFEFNNKIWTSDAEMTLVNRDFSYHTNIKTPFNNLRILHISANHRGPLSNFQNDLSIVYNKNKISANSQFKMNMDKIIANAEITTPFTDIRSATINFDHLGSLINFHNSGSMNINGHIISGESSFTMNPLSMSATILTPAEYTMAINHNGELTNFRNDISLHTPSKSFTGHSAFEFDGKNIITSMVVETPFHGFRNIAASFKHIGTMTNMTCELKANIGRDEITAHHIFKWDNNGIEDSVTIHTPFYGYRSIGHTFKHTGHRSIFNTEFHSNLEETQIIATGALTVKHDNIISKIIIQTPFEMFKNVDLSFKNKGSLTNFENEMIASLKGKTIKVSSAFSVNHHVDGKINIQTQFIGYRNFEITLNHEGDISSFTNKLSCTVNGQSASGLTTFSLERNNLYLTMDIATPFEAFKKFDMNLKHRGGIIDLNREFSILINGKKVHLTNTFNLNGDSLEEEINIQTPFEAFKTFKLSLTHNGPWNSFNNVFTTSLNGKIITARGAFNLTTAKVTSSLTVQTPFESFSDFDFSFKQRGSNYNNFHNEFITSLNGETIEAISSFNGNDNIAGSMSIKTPFKIIQNFDLTLNHNGPITNCNSVLSYSLNGQTVRGRTTLSLVGNNLDFTADIDTPFEAFKTFDMKFKHNGDMTDFNRELSVSMNGQKLGMTNSFKHMNENLEQSLNIQTPFEAFRNFEIALTHRGNLKSFNNELTTSLNGKTINGRSRFNLRGNSVDGTILIDTPFSMLRNFEIVLTHKGTPTSFNNELIGSLNGVTVTGKSAFMLYGNNMEGSLSFNTPFSYGDFDTNIRHQGSLTGFNNQLSMTHNGRTIKGSSTFNLKGTNVAATFDMDTPFEIIKKFELVATHKGNLKAFENQFITILNGQKMAVGLDFSLTGYDMSGSISLESPWCHSRTLGISSVFNGQATDFNYEISVNFDKTRITASTNFKKTISNLEGSLTVITPFHKFNIFEVTFNHRGRPTNFRQTVTMNINGQRGSMTNIFKNIVSIMGNFELKTPFEQMRSAVINFNHGGRITNFKNDAFFQINKAKYSGSMKFNIEESNMIAAASVQIPEEYGITFNHQGSSSDWSNDLTIMFDDRTMTGQSSMKNEAGKVSTSFTINTPFRGYETLSGRFNYEGDMSNLKQEFNIQYFGKAITQSCEFSSNGNLHEGIFRMTTPSPYFKTFMVKVNHKGSIANFKNRVLIVLNEQKYKANSEMSLLGKKKRVEMSINIPEEYSIVVVNKGKPDDFTNIIKVTTGTDKINAITDWKSTGTVMDGSFVLQTPFKGFRNFNFYIKHQNKNVMSTTASIKTPFPSLREASFELSHEGTLQDFKTNGKMMLPFKSIRSFSFEATHHGHIANFQSSGSVEYNDNKFRGDTSFRKTGSKIDTIASIQTSFESVRNAAFHWNHKGPLTGFTTSATAELNDQKMQGNLAFKYADTIELSGALNTPFTQHDIIFDATHKGILTDFTTTGNVELSNGKKYSGNVAFRKDGSNIEITASAQGFTLAFNHNGHIGAFRTIANVGTPIRQYKNFGIELNHNGNMKRFRSSAKIDTPFSQMLTATASVEHHGNVKDFTSTGSLEYNGQTMAGIISNTKTGNTYQGSARITTPYKMIHDAELKIEHNHGNNINGKAEVTYNGKKYIDADYSFGLGSIKSANLNIRAPKPLTAAIAMAHSGLEMNGDATVQIDGKPYSMNFGLKNEEGNRQLNVNGNLGVHTISLTTGYEITGEKIAHKSEIQWGNGPAKKMSYELEVSQTGHGHQTIYDCKLKINSRPITFQTNFNHKVNPGRRYLTEINIQRLGLRSDIISKQAGEFQTFLSMQHPSFTRVSLLILFD